MCKCSPKMIGNLPIYRNNIYSIISILYNVWGRDWKGRGPVPPISAPSPKSLHCSLLHLVSEYCLLTNGSSPILLPRTQVQGESHARRQELNLLNLPSPCAWVWSGNMEVVYKIMIQYFTIYVK